MYNITKNELLQYIVDYHTLSTDEFEQKYPIRPAEKPLEPSYVQMCKEMLKGIPTHSDFGASK